MATGDPENFNPDDGAPAFPSFTEDGQSRPGMSLRDAFAIAALQGIIRHPDAIGESEETIAIWSYKAADAMLEARKKK